MTPMRRRRLWLVAVLILVALISGGYRYIDLESDGYKVDPDQAAQLHDMYSQAANKLTLLEVKGRAPKTGYSRAAFGSGWGTEGSCDTRNIILNRDLTDVVVDDECRILSGVLIDPYSGKEVAFKRGENGSAEVQIDHVVALSDAWQKGAQQLSYSKRVEFSNDPLNLLAVSRESNQAKSDSDAASWLPPNKAFRCQYVSRQIEVKASYGLWVTSAEKAAIERVLGACLE